MVAEDMEIAGLLWVLWAWLSWVLLARLDPKGNRKPNVTESRRVLARISTNGLHRDSPHWKGDGELICTAETRQLLSPGRN